MAKQKRSLVFVILISLLISGELGAKENQLRIAFIQEWADLNPITYNLASTEALLQFVHRRFTNRTSDGGVVADLAVKIPNRKDKDLRYLPAKGGEKVQADWQIREDAKWGDGEPIVCADFKLGWEVGLNNHVATQSRSDFLKIEMIEWKSSSPKTCTVTYINQDWAFDRDLPFLLPSKHERAVFEKFKNENQAYERNSLYIKSPSLPGLYNGPYLVADYKVGSHLVLKLNPFFWANKSNISKIVVTHLSDTSALRANLIAKQIDAVAAVGFPLDVALSLDEEFGRTNAESRVRFQNSSIFQGLCLQMDRPPLDDLNVRTALAMAIDKKVLAKAFFKDALLSAEGFIPPQHASFKAIKGAYAKDQAKKILDQAGWVVGAGGIRAKAGKQLTLTFKTSAGIKIYENIQGFICNGFKQIGVACEIKNEPPRILLGESVQKGDFDIAMFGFPVPPDSSLKGYFASTEIAAKDNAWTGGNSCHWRNQKVDLLLTQFDSEWNLKKRHLLIEKMNQIALAEHPFIPLYHRREAMIIPRNLDGVADSFNGTGFAFPENWSLKE